MKELEARSRSAGGWGEIASDDGDRYMRELDAAGRRRRCHCGCGGKATHAGASNGLSLMSGCEMSVRRWVRDPQDVYRMQRERAAAGVAVKVLLRNDPVETSEVMIRLGEERRHG